MSLAYVYYSGSLVIVISAIVGNMLGKIVVVSTIAALVLLGVVLETTTPSLIGPLGILFVFILFYVSAFGVLTFLFYGISRLVAKIANVVIVKRPVEPLSLVESYYYSSVVALAPVLLVGMQSVGEVGVYDVSLVALFELVACIYIVKRTR